MQEKLPAGYVAGHAFGRVYQADTLDAQQFYEDFEIMLAAYKALVDRGGRTPSGAFQKTRAYTGTRWAVSEKIMLSSDTPAALVNREGCVVLANQGKCTGGISQNIAIIRIDIQRCLKAGFCTFVVAISKS